MVRSIVLVRLLCAYAFCAAVIALWLGFAPPSAAHSRLDGEDVISFTRLGASEKTLRGPYDATYVDFSLPATWELQSGAQLELQLNTFFATGNRTALGTAVPAGAYPPGQSLGGTLQIVLNSVTLGTVLLDQPGERTITIPITDTALLPIRSDERHFLSILLDTHEPCGTEQYTSVIVRPSSSLVLPHRLVAPSTDLGRLPFPLLQRAFLPDAATIVVPDAPTAAELQAALSISAGLGHLSGGALALDLVPIAHLTEQHRNQSHLIFVGKPSAFPILDQAHLPTPLSADGFAALGAAPDDGVVQMVVSPWNDAKVLLIASGSRDTGVVKAAQAISNGPVRAGAHPNLALIAATKPQAAAQAVNVDRTFADLGYDTQKLYGLGGQYAAVRFNVPPGQVADGDAYLDLQFVHTALLDYDQSNLMISLNDEPIASVRFDDNSTRLGSTRLVIPGSALRPGSNQLTMRADLLPRASCTDPRGSGLWIVIRSNSLLHLPLAPSQDTQVVQQFDLPSYPMPFTVAPNLDGMAFVLGTNDPNGWNIAQQIANDLGKQMQGSLVDLLVVYANSVPEDVRQQRDLLVVGRTDQIPLLGDLSSVLPAPFAPGSALASEPDAPVEYRMPKDASLGYLNILPAPWNANRTILTVLGSTDEGLRWAGEALTTPKLRGTLTGNTAVIQGERIDSHDTRIKAVVPTPTPTPTAPTADSQRTSIFLLIALSVVGLILLGSILYLFLWWRRRKTKPVAAPGTNEQPEN